VPWAILDTNVYVGHWERGLYAAELALARRKFVVRHSAVVLSELRRGARTPKALTLVEGLYELAHVRWEPTADDWWQAGRWIREIGDEQDWDRNKRRDFQNDALIGLTARRHGATIVTANRSDFELLAQAIDLRILVVEQQDKKD
jgi:predicted nucleic acid-binding protein